MSEPGEELELEKPEEVAQACFEDRKCRQHFVKLAEDWFRDTVERTIIVALQTALEPPGFNFYILISALGGVGLGIGLGVLVAKYVIFR